MPSDDLSTDLPQREQFAQTDWFMVAAAGQRASAESRAALEKLCGIYWYPLYAFVRRQGYGPEDAQDLTQEFFARLIEKNSISFADRDRGKFRSFLLTSLKHFLVNEWEKARAAKRGGGQVISWDQQSAEARYLSEPRDSLSPDKLYERRWAAAVLDHVLKQLRVEYVTAGKDQLFQAMKDVLLGEKSEVPYETLCKRLGMSEGALKVAVYRLRQRYKDLLQAEVAQTVDNPAEIDDEVRYLLHLVMAESR
jgi:RNA polymerase sigma factor (sigma-70 family)